jgi:ribosome-associated toxin RatA of RatAB toxin-antitoxin module
MRRLNLQRCLSLATGVVIAAALSPSSAAAPTEWQMLSNRNGMLIERRHHDDSRLYEVRATTYSPLPPAAIFETIWNQREHPQFVPYLKRLDLLSDTGDERVAYEQLAVPFARDRDYTVRIHKNVDREAQRYEVVFTNASDAGPPPDRNHVRVTHIHGGWLIEPGGDGKGTKVSYQVLSAPGGAIPSWIVNRAQTDAAAKLVRAMLQRTLDTHK